MDKAFLTIHPEFAVGTIDRRIFGSFIEHLGRCVYGGIYEPGHTTADPSGFREDVLAFGCMLIALLKNADRVRMACQAQLVNVIGLIMTATGGKAWRQTIFHPFQHAAQCARGQVLRVPVKSPVYSNKEFGDVPYLESVVTHDPETGSLTILAVNRSTDSELPVEAELRYFPKGKVKEHIVLEHADRNACNTAEKPDAVVPHSRGTAALREGRLQARLAPLSWNVIRLEGCFCG